MLRLVWNADVPHGPDLSFRGREMSHTEIGFETIRRAIADLETMGHADNTPRLVGRNINVMVSPLPANKRKPKYLREDDDHDEIEASEQHDDDHDDEEHDEVEAAEDSKE